MFCMQVSMKTYYKLELWFWGGWSRVSKVSTIARLQCLHNISKKKLEMRLIFCMQINIKVSYKLISTPWTPKFSIRWYYLIDKHDEAFKVLKVTSLQIFSNGVHFFRADKHQNLEKLTLSFLLETGRHARSIQNRNLVIFLQYFCVVKHSGILWESSQFCCDLFLGGCGQKWELSLRPWL